MPFAIQSSQRSYLSAGVSFKSWLERNPDKFLESQFGNERWAIDDWWEKAFYPHHEMVANDLHSKGLLQKGDYVIAFY